MPRGARRRRRHRRAARGQRLPERAPQQARHDAEPEVGRRRRDPQAARRARRRRWSRTTGPTSSDKLGIGYETLAAVNPRLVYASISGYGEDGPYRLRPGFDQIAQGMGGLMSITGLPGQGPVRVGIPIADLCAGIFCAYGIAVALIEREKSGKGQWVKSSLLQAQLFMLDFQAARWLMKGEVAEAGRQQPSDLDPDRRLPHPRRLHEPRGLGTQDLGAPVQRDRRARCSRRIPTTPPARCARSNRDRLHAEHRAAPARQRDTAEWVEIAQQGRRAVGPDLLDRPGVRRSAGAPSRHRREGRRRRLPRPAGDA